MITSIPTATAERAIREALEQEWPRYGAVQIHYTALRIESLKSVIPAVSSERRARCLALRSLYCSERLTPYQPIAIRRDDARLEVIVGPLIEVVESKYVIIDGLHRCMA